MKKTLITLLTIASVASAATAKKIEAGEAGTFTITSDNTEYQLDFNAEPQKGLTFNIVTTGAAKVSKTDAYSSENLEGSTINLTLGGVLTVSDNFGNKFKDKMFLNYDFGTVGKITANKVSVGGNDTKINVTTTTTSAQLVQATGDLYSRTLISANEAIWFSNVSAENGNWSLNDKGLLTLGYGYAGVLTYRENKYYDVTNGREVTLGAKQYALVLDGLKYGVNQGSSSLRLVANTIPEPTTATLSLLALAGLAARRRRK